MLIKCSLNFCFIFFWIFSFSQNILFPDIIKTKKVKSWCNAESSFCYYFTPEGKLYKAIKENLVNYTVRDTSAWVHDEISYLFDYNGNLITTAKRYRKNKLIPDSIFVGEIKYFYDSKGRMLEIKDYQENEVRYGKKFYYSDKLDSTIEYEIHQDSWKNIKMRYYHYNTIKKNEKELVLNNDSLMVNYNFQNDYLLMNIVEKSEEKYLIINFIYNHNYKLKGVSEYWIDEDLHKNTFKFKFRKGLLVSVKLKNYWYVNSKWIYSSKGYFGNFYEFYK